MFKPLMLMALVLVVILYGVAWRAGVGVAINLSPSMPRGVYLTQPVSEPKIGDWVSLCIPSDSAPVYRSRGYLPESSCCSSGLAPVMKPIVATSGDVVSIDHDGIRVNGLLIPNSLSFDTDSNDRPIAHLPLGWSKQLAANEYFAVATFHPRSLDSRYFGPIRGIQILQSLIPLILFEGA
jgi:conjugative transfer signal peptidase TraF